MLSQLICNHSLCISCFKQYYYCDKKNEKIQEFVWYVVNDGRLKWKIIIMLCLIGYIYTHTGNRKHVYIKKYNKKYNGRIISSVLY